MKHKKLLLISLMSCSVFAQDMSLESILNLNEEVYSASRKKQTDREAPQVVTIITPRHMKRFGFRTINEALQMVPGFDVQRQMRKEFVWTRGVRESALILVNSMPIMNPNDNEAILDKAFNLEMIDRVEVLRGPGGVLWGNNAFLGVVNVITKKAIEGQDLFEVNAHAGSYDQNKVGFVVSQDLGDTSYYLSGHRWRGEKHDVDIEANYNDGDGVSLVNGEGRQDTSRWDDIYLNVSHKDWSFAYKRDDHREYAPLTDLEIFSYPKGGNKFFEEDETELFQLTKNGKFSDNSDYIFRAQVLNRFTTINYPRSATGTPDTEILLEDMEITVYTADLQINTVLSEKHDIVWGATYQAIDGGDQPIRIKTNGTVTAENNYFQDHADFKSFSAYFQSTYKMSEDWNIGGGIRLENTDAKAESASGSETYDFEPQHILNLNSIHQLDGGDTLKFIASSGVRRPDMEQISGGEAFVGNDQLKDESSQSFEVDYLSQHDSNLTWRNNLSYTHIKNLIDFGPNNSGGFSADNLADANIYALESELKWNMQDGSFLITNLTYKTGLTDDGDDFSIIGTNAVTLNFLYSHQLNNIWSLNTYISHIGPKEDYFNENDGSVPSSSPKRGTVDPYTNIDLGVYAEKIYKNVDFSFFIYNLLDEEYFHQNRFTKTGYLHPRPGRNFAMNLYYQF